jgi:hypothetical protein
MEPANSFTYFIWLLIFISQSFLYSGCRGRHQSEGPEITGTLAEGQKLAIQYCGSCHLTPEPALLDKETWNNRVLPAMANQLGLEVWQKNHYYQNERSAISQSDWMKIVSYYDSLAPAQLSQNEKPLNPAKDWAMFSLKTPKENTSLTATTTLVAIDTADGQIYTSSSQNPDLYRWDKDLNASLVAKLPAAAIDILFSGNQQVVTLIGEMKAVDNPTGEVAALTTGLKPALNLMADQFIRPIQTISSDFDKDGLTDYAVCSFGHNKGGLYLLKQLPGKRFEKIAIREVAGATQGIEGDFNKDGWPDLIVLFAHADEGIWLFLNDQKGGFKTENMIRFPPVYGSSSFQLVDMNQDGKPDIVYTAGDNSDYSRILKPYHGLYIYINKGDLNGGNLKFEKKRFYPIHGATRVIARDFNMDGRIDLATIAFFADLKNNAAEGFIYFEQNKNSLDFTPHALPVQTSGRWICMDAEDWDGDGDPDIVLGNYSKGFLNQRDFKPNWNTHLPFVILENKTKK